MATDRIPVRPYFAPAVYEKLSERAARRGVKESSIVCEIITTVVQDPELERLVLTWHLRGLLAAPVDSGLPSPQPANGGETRPPSPLDPDIHTSTNPPIHVSTSPQAHKPTGTSVPDSGNAAGKRQKPAKKKGDPSPAFLRWWDTVTPKVGRGAAWRAWQSAADLPSVDALIEAHRVYREWLADYNAGRSEQNKRPQCNPATWLNQERWADEHEAAPPSKHAGNPGTDLSELQAANAAAQADAAIPDPELDAEMQRMAAKFGKSEALF